MTIRLRSMGNYIIRLESLLSNAPDAIKPSVGRKPLLERCVIACTVGGRPVCLPRIGFSGDTVADTQVRHYLDLQTALIFMDQERLKELLLEFREGRLELDQALERMRHLPYEDLGYAQVDHHRSIRVGFPEVIFGPGKTPEQIVGIASSLLERSSNLLITRAGRATFERVRAIAADAEFHESCGAIAV